MFKTIEEVSLLGKKIILRADLDVPLKGGRVADDYRLQTLLPTLKYLLKEKTKILVIGHSGRPEGKRCPELSLEVVAKHLAGLLGEKIGFLEDPEIGKSQDRVRMLENLRFWPGEENPWARAGQALAKKLASLGDVYVNEAFAVSHRTHTSFVGIPRYLPSYGGLYLGREVKELGKVLKNPLRPLIFILGGAKTETKAPLVPAFAKLADKVLLGGLLAFRQDLKGIPHVIFPSDILDDCDIGPGSIDLFAKEIAQAKTVVWNGPVGKWEDSRYERGTRAIAKELAALDAKTVVGGGDTIAALSAFGLLGKMSHVSLGGGAMLEFLADKRLPGLEVLGYYG